VINLRTTVGRLAKRLQERAQLVSGFAEQIHLVMGGLQRHRTFHHSMPAVEPFSAAEPCAASYNAVFGMILGR
jgi:hypothetical protein